MENRELTQTEEVVKLMYVDGYKLTMQSVQKFFETPRKNAKLESEYALRRINNIATNVALYIKNNPEIVAELNAL